MKRILGFLILLFAIPAFGQYWNWSWYRPYYPFYGYYGYGYDHRIPVGRREAAAWGTFIGGAIGYGVSGNPRGAAIGSGVGALIGLVKPSKKKKFVPAPPWAYRNDYRGYRDYHDSGPRSYRIKKEKKMLRYNVENHTEIPITVMFKPKYGRATTIKLNPFEGMEVQLPWKVQDLRVHALVLTEEGVMPNNLQPIIEPGEDFENDTIKFFVPEALTEETEE